MMIEITIFIMLAIITALTSWCAAYRPPTHTL